MDSFMHKISDVLSIVTISLCFVSKLPQIKILYDSKSSSGINVYSLYLELCSYSTVACYNYVNGYSFLSYLEYPAIIIQEYIILYLVLKYSSKLSLRMFITCILYFSLIFAVCQQILPSNLLTFVMPFCTPISLSSKVLQLFEIWRAKNADSVSVTTWFISAFTNLSRIYTVSLDSADILLLTNFTLSTFLSSSVMISAYYFHGKKKKI